MSRIATLFRWRDRLFRIHVVTGLAAAAWFLLMALTGVLINHQESFGLLDAEISDSYLPGYYRSDARTGTTRLNIIITDLHSGRIFGSQGHWMSDLVALMLIVSLISGFVSHQLKKWLQTTPYKGTAIISTPSPAQEESSRWDSSASAQETNPENSETSGDTNRKRVTAR